MQIEKRSQKTADARAESAVLSGCAAASQASSEEADVHGWDIGVKHTNSPENHSFVISLSADRGA